MKLISLQHGRFSEIDQLNGNFRKEFLKLKITLDTLSPQKFYLDRFPGLMFTLIEILPNLRHHHCSHGDNEHLSREYDLSHLITPIKIIGDTIDTVHLLEHMILELQCQISEMQVCSGLTCNYWEPENRYDIFVECNEPDLCTFSTYVSLAFFNQFLYRKGELFNIQDVIRLARTIYRQDSRSIRHIAKMMNWSRDKVISEIERLERFSFPFQSLHPVA
ncbi:MAG: hypothetical protein D6814_11165 [Calditrichaeota bacterium]|nr:MAG: hypothetical protein D6814_11165 [Calditrichota bacterium]